MAKKETIDFSEDRLLDMAADFIEDHNYMAALKMLNKNAELNYADDRSFLMYAEIYDDLGMYEECINNWFRYLDCAEDPDYAEAYEGLAISFMHLDDDQFSAYYYNKLLMETEDLTPESRREIIDSFLRKEENPLHFAYPPEKADYTKDISEGVDFIRSREPEKAIECFARVAKGNEKYLLARNYIAMTYILSDDCDKAEEECNSILEEYPNNVQALTTLAAVRTEQKRPQDAAELAKKLVALDVKEQEDIYKIATVCCENKMHDEAYRMLCRLDSEYVDGDRNMLYFKAASAYNSGRDEACFDTFDRLLTLFPEASVAQYYYSFARENAKKEDRGEISYFYRLPKETREQSLEFLSAVYSLSRTEVKKLAGEIDALECIKWCFDETESSDDNELHYVAAMCAVRAGYDNFVRDLLLNAFLPDNLKLSVIRELCQRNEENQFGIVVCNIYKCVDIYAIAVGRSKRKVFVGAYASLVSRFAIIDESYSLKFANAAERVYAKLEKGEALGLCKDEDTLAAVLLTESGVREIALKKFDVCDFFNADKNRYGKIMKVLEGEI
ncbi:MAG: hypothetical protein LUF82_00435 [Clostridia bacterium]|nr:hypothetical protein [Clostridia bacterium]